MIKPSTRAFFREGRQLESYSFKNLIHGYIYARWIYLYIGIGVGRHPLARIYKTLLSTFSRRRKLSTGSEPASGSMADGYHGKVLTKSSARALVMVQEDVTLRDLESVIPYRSARDIVLKNPDQIVALICPCRAARENPCLPLDVCLIIGEPFASFVMEHHPERSRKLTPAEAERMLELEHERGHVHHAFFKDAMLGRFYAICNCCSCCCGAMQAMRNGSPMISSSGYSAHLDQNTCIGCGTCIEACNFEALQWLDGLVSMDEAACMGCGICVDHCTEGAIVLERNLRKSAPLEIVKLMEAAIQPKAISV